MVREQLRRQLTAAGEPELAEAWPGFHGLLQVSSQEWQVYLCAECHQALPLGDKLQGFELQLLSQEVQKLKAIRKDCFQCCTGQATVLDPSEEEESLVRSSARALLLRLLSLLRRCLRPWSEAEREWVFSLARQLVERDVGWPLAFNV